MKFIYYCRDEHGTSVVEVMVATMVFMVTMVGGLHYYMVPQATFARKKINRYAVSLAQHRLESLIALGFNGVITDSNETNTPVTVSTRSGTRSTKIVKFDDAADGTGVGDSDSNVVDYKVITVDVAWNDGKDQTVSFMTVLTDIPSSASGDTSSASSFTASQWGRKCELVIQAGKVSATLTSFPLLLTKDTLPTEMLDSNGSYPALNGGGDVRFSSDEAGQTQLAGEIVTFTTDENPSNGNAEIWVNVPTISSTSNTSIWVWYNKAGKSQPAVDKPYGTEAVWNNGYLLVQHMSEDPEGASPQFIDATSSNYDGVNNGGLKSSDLKNGVIGSCIEFDGSSDDDIDLGIWDVTGSALTVQHWIYVESNPDTDGRFFSRATGTAVSDYWLMTGFDAANVKPRFRLKTNSLTTSIEEDGISEKTWHFMAATYDGSNMRIWIDNQNIKTEPKSGTITTSATVHNYLADNPSGSRQLEGNLDEVRVSNVKRSDAWLLAEYNNQIDPATFVVEGTPQSP